METIIQKMQELSTEMTQKNNLLTKQLTEVEKMQGLLEVSIKENTALAKDLKKREAEVEVVESVMELDKKLTLRRAAIEIDEATARKADGLRGLAISAREKKVDEAEEGIKGATASLKMKQDKLEADKKAYKANVLRSVQTDLDAAKKKV